MNPGGVSSFQVLSPAAPPRLRITGPDTVALCSAFPAQHFLPLGWAVHLLPSVSSNSVLHADLVFAPRRHCLRLPETKVLYTCHKLLLVGLLRTIESNVQRAAEPETQVKVQVHGQTLWLGSLPADMTFEDLEDLWQQAGLAVSSLRDARVYSGPKPIHGDCTLLQAQQGPNCSKFSWKGTEEKGSTIRKDTAPRRSCRSITVWPSAVNQRSTSKKQALPQPSNPMT